MGSAANEIAERYGEAFAKAFAVFVREMSAGEAAQRPAAADRPAPQGVGWVNSEYLDEAALARELDDVIRTNQAKARAGNLESLEVTGDLASKEIATRLRAMLKDRGMTQKALAAKLGVTPARVSHVLKRPDQSKVDTLRKIAHAIGIHVREVLD